MGFTLIKEAIRGRGTVVVKQRLCRTERDTLVLEGHPLGRWLYATPGQAITKEDAIRYGVAEDGCLKEAEPPETKVIERFDSKIIALVEKKKKAR